jgi:hypothetical protein
MMTTPPEKLEAQTIDMQGWLPFQFLTSLLRRCGGWFANHALHLSARVPLIWIRSPWASRSLSFCRSTN